MLVLLLLLNPAGRACTHRRASEGALVQGFINHGGTLAGRAWDVNTVLPDNFQTEICLCLQPIRNGSNHTNLTAKSERVVSPQGPWRYHSPVVLLIGQECMSSNESFVKRDDLLSAALERRPLPMPVSE